MINMEKRLTEEELEQYLYAGAEEQAIVAEVAIRSFYHPAGYGMYGAKIVETPDGYYAVWARGESCD